jgi:hypothetical protein
MVSKAIFGILAIGFLIAAVLRIYRDRTQVTPASRTWLTIGIIFALVSGYLWMTG